DMPFSNTIAFIIYRNGIATPSDHNKTQSNQVELAKSYLVVEIIPASLEAPTLSSISIFLYSYFSHPGRNGNGF
ncbi:MAG: hypothetical protein ACUVQY_11520, partial [Thermoproteota archaeon]